MDNLKKEKIEKLENQLKQLKTQIQEQLEQEKSEFENKCEEDKRYIDLYFQAQKQSKLKKVLFYVCASLFPVVLLIFGTVSLITAPFNFAWLYCYISGVVLEGGAFAGGAMLKRFEKKEIKELKKDLETRVFKESSYLLDLKIKYLKTELALKKLLREQNNAALVGVQKEETTEENISL